MDAYEGEPNLNPAFLKCLVGRILDHSWNGKQLAGAHAFSAQNIRAILGITLGYAIARLLGVLFIREANCRHITLSVQK